MTGSAAYKILISAQPPVEEQILLKIVRICHVIHVRIWQVIHVICICIRHVIKRLLSL